MAFTSRFSRESEDEEVERMRSFQPGSRLRRLASLPVNIRHDVRDRIIELPDVSQSRSRMVVVPIEYRGDSLIEGDRRPRHDGSWECVVVASDNDAYPVGGYRVVVLTAELVRGTVVLV